MQMAKSVQAGAHHDLSSGKCKLKPRLNTTKQTVQGLSGKGRRPQVW